MKGINEEILKWRELLSWHVAPKSNQQKIKIKGEFYVHGLLKVRFFLCETSVTSLQL
jgi:hypothetical protein